jgi:hypothetical protein
MLSCLPVRRNTLPLSAVWPIRDIPSKSSKSLRVSDVTTRAPSCSNLAARFTTTLDKITSVMVSFCTPA